MELVIMNLKIRFYYYNLYYSILYSINSSAQALIAVEVSNMYSRQDRDGLIIILRFGSAHPADLQYRWLTYTKIAQLLKCSASLV